MGSFETFDVAVRRRRHGPIASAIDLLAGLRRVERVAHVRANERGVFLDGEHVIAPDAVRHAYVVPREGTRPVVVFETAAQTVELFVQDVARGNAMLEAMTLVAHETTTTFEGVHVADGSRRWIVIALALALTIAAFALVLGFGGGTTALLLPMLVWIGVLGILHEAPDGVVIVGADGVAFRNRARERFLPHGTFSVEATDVARATTAMISVGARKFAFHFRDAAACRAFVRRVACAPVATRPLTTHATAARLARGARADGEWLRDLRALAGADYRSTALPTEHLWRVVEDPFAPSSARAGAALGLHATLDDEGRTRLRGVAEACASPRLRVALDIAATIDDPDEIERAVEECAAEESQRG